MSKRPKAAGLVTGTLFFGVLLALFLSALNFIRNHSLVYPTPETESTFFKTYTPDTAIKSFARPDYLRDSGTSTSGSAGKGATRHQKTFAQLFAIQVKDRQALMAALSEDILAELTSAGVKVIQKTGNEEQGFDITYVDGNRKGTVALKPLDTGTPDHLPARWTAHSVKLPRPPSCPDEVAVDVTIVVDETWYKTGA